MELKDVDVYLSLENVGLLIQPKIKSVEVGQSFVNAYYGRYESSTFLANLALQLVLQLLGGDIENLIKFELPSEVFGLFSLSDLKLDCYEEHVYIGLTPTFLPIKANKFIDTKLT